MMDSDADASKALSSGGRRATSSMSTVPPSVHPAPSTVDATTIDLERLKTLLDAPGFADSVDFVNLQHEAIEISFVTPVPPATATEAAAPTGLIALSTREAKWSEQYLKLKAYHAGNGHCNVLRSYKADPALGRWVDKQRTALKNGKLNPDRIARLDAIGLQGDRQTETWNEQYSKLKAHHAHNGHCNVPLGYQADPALGQWVANQHTALRHGTLKPDRVARLDAIGLQGDRQTETWNENCSKLEAYHARCGHCNVPRYKADPALRRWVDKQRKALKNGTLKPDRVARLDAIGFQANHMVPSGRHGR